MLVLSITLSYMVIQPHKRKHVWNQLLSFHSTVTGPWVWIGDFNQVLNQEDKFSLRNQACLGATELYNCLQEASMIPMNATGVQYTWKNNREGEEFVCERLDRVFVNLDWLHTYKHSSLKAWPISISDHAPLILETHKKQIFQKRPQRFEAMWLLNPSCKKLIEDTLQEKISGSVTHILTTKFKKVQKVCNEWNKNDLGNIHKRLA